MYELYYSTGGHGGPYLTQFDARIKALRLLKGNLIEQWIEIKNRNTGITVARITRTHLYRFRELGVDR